MVRSSWLFPVFYLLLLLTAGCGGPNPLHSDSDFESYVRNRYSAERGQELTDFVGSPLVVEGNVEKRTFTAKSGSNVTVQGALTHDTSSGVVGFELNFKYD